MSVAPGTRAHREAAGPLNSGVKSRGAGWGVKPVPHQTAVGAWVGQGGDALSDPGAPLGPAMTVSAGGVHPGAADGPVAGYSVLRADDIESAVSLVRDHPFVARGGSLTVLEAVSP